MLLISGAVIVAIVVIALILGVGGVAKTSFEEAMFKYFNLFGKDAVSCLDGDKDTYGAAGTNLSSCTGSITLADCDDASASVNPSAIETCDNIDNDCDNSTDESLTKACGSDTGACQSGIQTCSAGAWGNCTEEIIPATETCDGIDNDCDGSIDEDYATSQTSCGVGACASTGLMICSNSGTEQNTCVANAPSTEICDNIDNDCDGSIDEDSVCEPKGVYDLHTADTLASRQALSKSYVDGSVIRARWDLVEPADNTYDWSKIDADIARAEQYGKDVTLEVIAGIASPQWAKGSVYTGLCDPNGDTFEDSSDDGKCNIAKQCFCYLHTQRNQVYCMPFPWNSTYLEKWHEFVDELGKRYASNPSVKVVRATGPTTASETNTPLSISEWSACGFTASSVKTNLKTAWKNTTERYETAFGKKKIIAVAVQNVFSDDSVAKDIVDYGYNTYGNKFGVMGLWLDAQDYSQNTLMLNLKNLIKSYSDKTFTGYQTVWLVTTDPSDRMNCSQYADLVTGLCDDNCKDKCLRGAVDNGLADGVKYVEIYEPDILAQGLQAAIEYAHEKLTG